MIEVYLDNSASTKPRKEVVDEMLIPMLEIYGNPSSLHKKGVMAENLIKKEKERVAKIINAQKDEIIFTSGGTESNNIAIRGSVKANKNRGNHIITTKFEHSSVLHTFWDLEKEGYDVTYLDISKDGYVDMSHLEKDLSDDTIFVSIMFVNSEVGTIQPIYDSSRIIRKKAPNALFHVDAVQAFCKIDIDVKDLDVDLMSLSSHKIHGPKGVGGLYIKKGSKILSVYTGGAQELYLRPGTENVPWYCWIW
jgi:cysteine desulfurase